MPTSDRLPISTFPAVSGETVSSEHDLLTGESDQLAGWEGPWIDIGGEG